MKVCEISQPQTCKPARVRRSALCVDDSPEILEISRIILEADGYQVFTTDNGIEALELLKLHSVDAAIIDNIMPGINGVDLAREIKRSALDVLVVMYSGTLCGEESFPFIDACLSKGQGPLALRKLLDSLLLS
jgi:CheY-like chemotaxis protein